MRVKTIILFLFISLTLQAAKHYVATGGGGAGTLVSPFANLTQVNAHTFVAGDSLLFNKGDTFYGTLTMDASGTAGNPIYIGSYGTGAMPIITGFSTLASWTDNGDGRFWATVTGAEAQTNMVTVDGVNTAMGRYPDAGTNLNYEHFVTTVSIQDHETVSTSTDWTGADAVINKTYWVLERCRITDHTGDIITYNAYNNTPYTGTNGRYFFIQNDLRCVDSSNEWFHDYAAGRLYIWGNPSAKVVKIATQKYLIDTQTQYDYITIDGLHLIGSIRAAINIGNEAGMYGNNNNITVKNCLIEFAGLEGIAARMSTMADANGLFTDNTIRHCNGNGIFAQASGVEISRNTISYIGMVPGTNLRGSDAQGIFTRCSSEGGEFTVTYNNISYTCHNGIGGYYAEYNGTITHNFIDHAMQVTDDGGGIYFGATNDFQSTVAYNIILNTGVGNTAAVISRGIYMDTKSDNVIIDKNVVAYSKGAGIILHSGDDIIITNNLSYDNGYSATDRYASLLFLEDDTYSPSINVTTANNKFIARTTSQIAFYNTHSDAEILANGTFDYNYYARPIDDDEVFYYSGGLKTLAQWKTFTGEDAHSLGSPTAIDNDNQLHFIYNATQESTYWDLSAPMIDVTGADYSGQVALLPYTGLVLIGNGTVTEHVFGGSGTTFAKDADGNFLKDTNNNFIKIIQ